MAPPLQAMSGFPSFNTRGQPTFSLKEFSNADVENCGLPLLSRRKNRKGGVPNDDR